MGLENEVQPTFDTYIGDLLNFMRYCKIWKPDTFTGGKNIFVAGIVGVLLLSDVMLIVTAFMDFKYASNDLTSFASYVGPVCLQCIGLMKWSYCIWKVEEIASLIQTLERCHYLSMKINKNDLGLEKYKAEMTATRRHYLRFLYGWFSLCMYGIFHWCSNPLFLEIKENGFATKLFVDVNGTYTSRTRNLPYLGWRPWNVDGNIGYVSMFIVQFIGGLSSAIGSITYDVFYISTLMIVCAHLRYLNDSLIDETDAARILRFEEIKHEASSLKCVCSLLTHFAIIAAITAGLEFEIKLKNCVDHHKEIIAFLNGLEVLASPPMFVQCLENIIVLCMVSLEASTVEVNTNFTTIMKLWSMLEYFLSVIAQLFVYCYYATEIRTLGLQLADSVYQACWEQLTCSYAKWDKSERNTIRRVNFLIQMFMFRAQRAILLTGGPFYVLSLETFKSVVGLAMSNSVILRQVVSEQS